MATALRGAVAGVAATIAMTVQMWWADRSGRVDAVAPEHIAGAALTALHLAPSRRQHLVTTGVAHFGYGAAAGLVHTVLARGRRRPLRSGVAYGLGLAVAGYQGWVPALGILPPLTRQMPGRRTEILGSHLVYGAALVVVSNWLSTDGRADPTTERSGRNASTASR